MCVERTANTKAPSARASRCSVACQYLAAAGAEILAGHAAPRCARGWRLCVCRAFYAHLLQAVLSGAAAATSQRRLFPYSGGSRKSRLSSLPALPPERTAATFCIGGQGGRGIGKFRRGKRAARCAGGSDRHFSRKTAPGVSPHDRADAEGIRPSGADGAF